MLQLAEVARHEGSSIGRTTQSFNLAIRCDPACPQTLLVCINMALQFRTIGGDVTSKKYSSRRSMWFPVQVMLQASQKSNLTSPLGRHRLKTNLALVYRHVLPFYRLKSIPHLMQLSLHESLRPIAIDHQSLTCLLPDWLLSSRWTWLHATRYILPRSPSSRSLRTFTR